MAQTNSMYQGKSTLGSMIPGSMVALALSLGACSTAGTPPAQSPSSDNSETETAEPEVATERSAEPLAEPVENEEHFYVEGVAGGAMVRTLELEAEVISVDQSKREAVLRGPAGNEVVVKVGKDARNFYQVKPGDRVMVAMARELVIYVEDEGEKSEDGTVVAGGRAREGAQPGGAVVATTKVTAKIKTLDAEARMATLTFPDGKEETFDVRPDVDMTKYKVGQSVVFLVTELLALEVKTL